MKLESINLDELTPMMRQYADIKLENKDAILFFRLGDFYEMFFEDATLVSKILEITLTGKMAGLKEKIPMCGVPHHSADGYIEKLVMKGYRVAIVEQLSEPGKGIVERGIVRIVSRGTLTEPTLIDEFVNNYIGNISYTNKSYILSFVDITTGDISVINLGSNISDVILNVVSYDIKELVVNKINEDITNILRDHYDILITKSEISSTDYIELVKPLDNIYIESVKLLLGYITNNNRGSLVHIKKIQVIDQNNYLKTDIHTKRNLELTETLRLKSRTNSLLGVIDRTVTAAGARLLKRYIESPLVNKEDINKRLDMVEALIEDFLAKDDLRKYLDSVYDIERLTGKIAVNSINARDLLQLKKTLSVMPLINDVLKKVKFSKTLNDLSKLHIFLDNAIYEEPPISLREGYIIKTGYNDELDELKEIRRNGKAFIAKFEEEEKIRTGIGNLKIGYNRVFGYYIEITKGQLDKVDDSFNYERKQTLANAERYISPILKEKEAIILGAEEKIIELEYDLFIKLREDIKKYIKLLQENADIISEIDVLQSFSVISEDNNYIRPIFTEENIINIKDSRHPVVEEVMPGTFVSNDIIMNEKTSVLLVTGPNMAGKSTYMRQLAITVVMAQIGCFVPASSCKIKIFDAIYTRIGASDDLVSGKSTFMVEMDDANYAIANATQDSLILFDELGRGTATYDGIALAQSILEYIHNEVKCKTIFSTHYHELVTLEDELKGLHNVHVSAAEEDGKLTFLHEVKNGSVDRSYGVHVAALAGLPSSIIKRSSEILNGLEVSNKFEYKIQESMVFDTVSEIEEEIKKIDITNLTPLEALNKLYELKSKLK